MEFCDFIAKMLGNFVKNKYLCKQNRIKKSIDYEAFAKKD